MTGIRVGMAGWQALAGHWGKHRGTVGLGEESTWRDLGAGGSKPKGRNMFAYVYVHAPWKKGQKHADDL